MEKSVYEQLDRIESLLIEIAFEMNIITNEGSYITREEREKLALQEEAEEEEEEKGLRKEEESKESILKRFEKEGVIRHPNKDTKVTVDEEEDILDDE